MPVLNKKAVAIGVIVLAAAVAAWKFLVSSDDDQPKMAAPKPTETKPVAKTPAPEAQPASTAGGAVRTLRVETSYQSPAGTDPVAFSLMVDENGVIVDAKTEVLTTHPISKMRQEAFAAELPMVVKGKKLSELAMVDKVGKSSLTSGAFNSVIGDLQKQL